MITNKGLDMITRGVEGRSPDREATRGVERDSATGKPKTQIDIEDLLVWAYRDLAVDRRIASDIAGTEREYILRSWASTWGRVSEYAQLGTFVDTSFRAPVHASSVEEDDDAMTIHNAVLTLPSEACVLVIIHARANTRPGLWDREPPRLVPILRGNGKPETIEHNKRPVACPIRWSHDPERWEWDQQQYRTWRAALDVLADELAGKLIRYEAKPSLAFQSPWSVSSRLRSAAHAEKTVVS